MNRRVLTKGRLFLGALNAFFYSFHHSVFIFVSFIFIVLRQNYWTNNSDCTELLQYWSRECVSVSEVDCIRLTCSSQIPGEAQTSWEISQCVWRKKPSARTFSKTFVFFLSTGTGRMLWKQVLYSARSLEMEQWEALLFMHYTEVLLKSMNTIGGLVQSWHFVLFVNWTSCLY